MNIRLSTLTDLPSILSVQASCYLEVEPERPEVLSEKFNLFPRGCFVAEVDSEVVGYMFSHPWKLGSPPKLDAFLLQIPINANTYYIHDIAVHPSFRGAGIAKLFYDKALDGGKEGGYKSISLIAVQESEKFWKKLGFVTYEQLTENLTSLKETLSHYQASAVYMVNNIL